MKISAPVAAVIVAAVPLVAGQGEQIVFDLAHNASTIIGTWSTGSQAVRTGPGFANPANKSFTYPKNAGVSYSFDNAGFYEVARYRFLSNASEPSCIKGVVNWHHGKYSILNNGSIILTPLGDGYQQIQDPCAAVSNFIEDYNITERYRNWRIFDDQTTGFKLHLFEHDGFPIAPMFQVSPTPVMNPTKMLRNVTPPAEVAGGNAKNLLSQGNGAQDQSKGLVQVTLLFATVLGSIAVLL